MTLSTHVLDTSLGAPAQGIALALFRTEPGMRIEIAQATTNADGRTGVPLAGDLAPGIYELAFDVAPYFAKRRVATFFDVITLRFRIDEGNARYHVPLLLSPWGYSTYRGS